MPMQLVLYDLCCGGGGVARVALSMGFRVIGVDFEPQPEYPGEFILADALRPPLQPGADLVWVSPYCQGYSPMHWAVPSTARPRQVNEFREVAKYMGNHYVIENSQTCDDLRDAVRLCGFMFGLPIIRHRKFEASFLLPQPKHLTHRGKWYQSCGNLNSSLKVVQEAMGLPGMSRKSLVQAVPWAYTWYVLTWYLVSRKGR